MQKINDAALNGSGYALKTNLADWVSIFDADNGNNEEMIFDIQGSSLSGQGTAVSTFFPQGMQDLLEVVLGAIIN